MLLEVCLELGRVPRGVVGWMTESVDDANRGIEPAVHQLTFVLAKPLGVGRGEEEGGKDDGR